MARTIELTNDAVRIRYSGLTLWIMLLREVRVPYTEIASVAVGLDPLPRFYVRIGEYLPRRGTIRGRFRTGGRWYFLDLRHRERAVALHLLPGARFALVAVEPDGDPEELAAGVRDRL